MPETGHHIQNQSLAGDIPAAQALGVFARQIAIGDKRAETWNTYLPTVSMAGKQNIDTAFAHRIDDSQVWCVAHADYQVSTAGQFACRGNLAEVIETVVCVINADEVDADTVDDSATLAIVQV